MKTYLRNRVQSALRWIRVANLLADETHPPDPLRLGETPEDKALLGRVSVRWDVLFSRSLNADDGPPFSSSESLSDRARYELVYSINLTLTRIAAALADVDHMPWNMFRATVSLPVVGESRAISIFRKDGHAVPQADNFGSFVRMLEFVDCRKFRRCPVCATIFYAVRANQIACSNSHAKTLAQRKWRAGEKKRVDQATPNELLKCAGCGIEVRRKETQKSQSGEPLCRPCWQREYDSAPFRQEAAALTERSLEEAMRATKDRPSKENKS